MLLANVYFLTCNTAICLDQNQASRNLIVTTSYKKRWLEIVLDRYATSQAFIFFTHEQAYRSVGHDCGAISAFCPGTWLELFQFHL